MSISCLTMNTWAQALQATQYKKLAHHKTTSPNQNTSSIKNMASEAYSALNKIYQSTVEKFYSLTGSKKTNFTQQDIELDTIKNFTLYSGKNIAVKSEESYTREIETWDDWLSKIDHQKTNIQINLAIFFKKIQYFIDSAQSYQETGKTNQVENINTSENYELITVA